jgi:membrane-associated phospholipid phosphatase
MDAFLPHERILLAYFLYLAALSLFKPVPAAGCAMLLAIPPLLAAALRWESIHSRPWSRTARLWAPIPLLLAAYSALEWFAVPPIEPLQRRWLAWDNYLLLDLGLRAAVESLGPVLPFLIESAYLLLYVLPFAAFALVTRAGDASAPPRFLRVLLAGTLCAYSLIPLVPVASPRVEFPRHAPPSFEGFPRSLTTSLLDRLDIDTSVFPSGHVAVAASTVLALHTVLRFRRRFVAAAAVYAATVYLATIYGRYHYAADGAASVLIVLACWSIFFRKTA